MTIKSVGVIGAGQMGNGIAHVFAAAGFDVLINDINPDAVTAAIAKIDRNMTRLVERGQMDAVAQAERDGADQARNWSCRTSRRQIW